MNKYEKQQKEIERLNNMVTNLKAKVPKKKTSECPYCKSKNTIIFDSDNDLCNKCGKWFPV